MNEYSLRRLRVEFPEPPAEYKAMPMYSVDYTDPDRYADGLVDGGWGGCNAQFPNQGTEYLQLADDWSFFVKTVEAIGQRQLSMWIYDERAYPSGKAGTLVLDGHSELEAQGLYYDASDVDLEHDQYVRWRIPSGKPYLVCAMRVDAGKAHLSGRLLRLTAKVQAGVMHARLPAGHWRLMAFVQAPLFTGTHAELLQERYPNLMDPEATRRFIQITHERYQKNIGSAMGRTVQAFFTDEPSLLAGYLVDTDQPLPVVNWWHGLPAAYRRAAGRSIDEALPALFNNVGPDTGKLRCQYYHVVSQLIARHYFAAIRRWCAEHKVASTGHLLWEESLLYHVPFYGSVWPSLRELDWPGIDVLGCVYGSTSGSRTEGGPVTPKLIASVARLHRKPRTVTESFCFVDMNTPLESVLAHTSWEWVLGINTMNTLSFPQTHPVSHHRRFNAFVGRLSLLLRQGQAVCDVAVLYPIASVWAKYVPNRHPVWRFDTHPGAAAVDETWRDVSRQLLECPVDFDYLDEADLVSARIQGKTLKVGAGRYRMLVLPAASWLRSESVSRMVRFAEQGGEVVCVGELPQHCWSGETSEFSEDCQRLRIMAERGHSVRMIGSATELHTVLRNRQDLDVQVLRHPQPLYYHHRALERADVYFFVNNAEQPFESDVVLRSAGRVELWDPWTAEIREVQGTVSRRRTQLHLSLGARRSVFIVLDRT